MVVVTGVSGSGKSTLVHDVIFRSLAGAAQGRRKRARAHALRGVAMRPPKPRAWPARESKAPTASPAS